MHQCPRPRKLSCREGDFAQRAGVGFTPAGSVEGGAFHFSAGHFEWLARFAEALGLGGVRSASAAWVLSTLAFCDALMTWYGSEDESTAAGASYAIEHWAAAGFGSS